MHIEYSIYWRNLMAKGDVIIQLVNMGKAFHTSSGDVVALDDINLDIKEGSIQGIIGLSGAGKSTLVRCINYLEIPQAVRLFSRASPWATFPTGRFAKPEETWV